jgi:hypothetical protein
MWVSTSVFFFLNCVGHVRLALVISFFFCNPYNVSSPSGLFIEC